MKDLILVARCKNAYDIYLKKVSSLSYAPDVYVITKNGRSVKDAPLFETVADAESYIRELNTPSLRDFYKGGAWEGRPINDVFRNLGEVKAESLYRECVKSGMCADDAWMSVYSVECSLDAPDKEVA